ncbi:hypothetical protein [Gelidibacter japonicus]|uniref:hypothetical protein n=1 Tax=Gelidibacter japonicus TaxID=1962232 RepID=UPI003A92AB62
MKTTTINLRINQITKNQLEILSERKDENISSVIREAVNQFLDNEIYLEPELAKTKNGLHLIKTAGFTEFIFWLYQKTINPEVSEIREFYIQFIDLINECKKYPIFNSDLILEFDKVLSELNTIVYDEDNFKMYFQFANFGENSFDYQVLADFMYTFRYDQEDNKVIHCK